MKLIFCDTCSDVFKLSLKLRECECGQCKGRYDLDGEYAVTNGKGHCIAIGNGGLARAIFGNPIFDYTCRHSGLKLDTILAWVRPHDGPMNPRSRVDPDL